MHFYTGCTIYCTVLGAEKHVTVSARHMSQKITTIILVTGICFSKCLPNTKYNIKHLYETVDRLKVLLSNIIRKYRMYVLCNNTLHMAVC